ncbi:MAG: cytochrome c-type biogenesis protein CcmH [Nitrospirota bacterium]
MDKINHCRTMSLLKVILLISLALLASTGTAFSKDIPLMKINEVTDLIMSPGCNYTYTLTLCPSSAADQMKELVKDKLLRGESKEQILAYFEQVYGPRILAQPARKGFYFLAWWFPYFLLFDGMVIAGVILYIWRKREQKRSETAADDPANQKIDADIDKMLEEEVRKFREE